MTGFNSQEGLMTTTYIIFVTYIIRDPRNNKQKSLAFLISFEILGKVLVFTTLLSNLFENI